MKLRFQQYQLILQFILIVFLNSHLLATVQRLVQRPYISLKAYNNDLIRLGLPQYLFDMSNNLLHFRKT
jgi:hypothetical protein